MSDELTTPSTVKLTTLNSLVKELNDIVSQMDTATTCTKEEAVVRWAKAQGIAMTIASESSGLLLDLSKIIGALSNPNATSDNPYMREITNVLGLKN
jgi:hypothetical protein